MKRYLIIAAAVLLGAIACTKSEPLLETEENEISFQVANYLSQTKANVAYEGDSFGVYAWFDAGNAIDDEQGQDYMINAKVVPAAPGWKVEGKTYYWPKTGNIDFFAYAPYNATATSKWVTYTDDAAPTLSGSFTSATGKEDYMYSSIAYAYSGNSPQYNISDTGTVDGDNKKVLVSNGVPILFHHALAQLSVQFKASTLLSDNKDTKWEITVNTAEFKNTVKDGTLSMTKASPAAGVNEWPLPTSSIWTPGSTTFALQAVADEGQGLTTTEELGTLEEYTVLPQALSTVTFHINYTIKAYNKASGDAGYTLYSTETIDNEYNVGKVGSDEGIFGDYWQMNKKYVYTVIISPSTRELYFDPAVADWDATVVTGEHTIS